MITLGFRRSRVIRRFAAVMTVALIGSAGAGCSSENETVTNAVTNTATTSTETTTTSVNSECEETHAGHSAMMWTPVMADEMTEAGCGWPAEPFLVDLGGGRDDPDLSAPFEPRRYDELWDAITASGLALCTVGTAAKSDRESPGRAFGFDYQLALPGCPNATPTGLLHVDEFGTEAQRDSAARAADSTGTSFVLGRWVIRLEGEASAVEPKLLEVGAQPVA